MKLDGNDPEVEDLHRRPEHKVGLESRQVYVPELVCQCPLSSSFGNCHKGEEASQTYPVHVSISTEGHRAQTTTYREAQR